VEKHKRLLDLACRIGEVHAERANLRAAEIRILRNAIRRAIFLLRCGRTANALHILESLDQEK
jgi:hypothetical protein